MALPPPPIQDLKNLPMSYQLWFNQIKQFVAGTGGTIAWATISKAGSNLNELTTRDHASLQALQGGSGGQYYHLTLAETGRLLSAAQYARLLTEIQYNNLTALATITSSPTTLTSANGYVLCDATGGAITLNLPAATTRYRFHIKRINSGANSVVITPNGADTIEGAATVTLTAQYESRTIYSDGSGVWYIEAST